jgi:hypothetical protein
LWTPLRGPSWGNPLEGHHLGYPNWRTLWGYPHGGLPMFDPIGGRLAGPQLVNPPWGTPFGNPFGGPPLRDSPLRVTHYWTPLVEPRCGFPLGRHTLGDTPWGITLGDTRSGKSDGGPPFWYTKLGRHVRSLGDPHGATPFRDTWGPLGRPHLWNPLGGHSCWNHLGSTPLLSHLGDHTWGSPLVTPLWEPTWGQT